MLYANTGRGPRMTSIADAPVASGVWFDLMDGIDQERQTVEALTGRHLPDRSALAEVESSSRLNVEGTTLTLSMPISYRGADGSSNVTPLGFVLTPDHLVTIRFAELPVFDAYAERFAVVEREPCAVGAFVGLLEAIVDRQADVLEGVGSELDRISREVFGAEAANKRPRDVKLGATLRAIGQRGDALSNLRDGLLGVSRIVPFVTEHAEGWIPADLLRRFKTLRRDVQSLADYDAQLANKVQFLLDATLGFISIEQNNGIKVLTVVSVVGVPPTLLASIYGMNFKWIPELQWEYGYFYGLGVIVLSALLPLWWFKRRGWV